MTLSLLSVACEQRSKSSDPPSPSRTTAAPTAKATGLDGAALAAAHCQRCHMMPEPEHLPKETWPFVLAWMDNYLGHTNLNPDNQGLVIRAYVPPQPVVSKAELAAIHAHFLDNAPTQAQLRHPPRDLPTIELFDAVTPKLGLKPHDMAIALHVDDARGHLYVGTGRHRKLHIFKAATGERLDEVQLPTEPIDIDPFEGGYRLTLMGSFDFDEALGELRHITGFGPSRRDVTLLRGAHRITQSASADLDGDGHEDIALVGFGDGYGPGGLGTLSVLWSTARFDALVQGPQKPFGQGPLPGALVSEQLLNRAGPLNCVIADFDKDGRQDILLAASQAYQELLLYQNLGNRRFKTHKVMETYPSFGLNHVAAADFDKDGHLDLFISNGNNMELPNPPLRPYHGVRVLRGKGDLSFEEVAFLPVYGAMESVAADFDNDGDLDIATVAFFPDWEQDHPTTFVYFQNDGDWTFTPHRMPEKPWGRWMRLAQGDVNGDGAPDIVLGSGSIEGGIPKALRETWNKTFETVPAIAILRHR